MVVKYVHIFQPNLHEWKIKGVTQARENNFQCSMCAENDTKYQTQTLFHDKSNISAKYRLYNSNKLVICMSLERFKLICMSLEKCKFIPDKPKRVQYNLKIL